MAKKVCDRFMVPSIIAYEEADTQVRSHPLTGQPPDLVITGDTDFFALGHVRVILVHSYRAERFRYIDMDQQQELLRNDGLSSAEVDRQQTFVNGYTENCINGYPQ